MNLEPEMPEDWHEEPTAEDRLWDEADRQLAEEQNR